MVGALPGLQGPPMTQEADEVGGTMRSVGGTIMVERSAHEHEQHFRNEGPCRTRPVLR